PRRIPQLNVTNKSHNRSERRARPSGAPPGPSPFSPFSVDDEEAPMHTPTTELFQHMIDEKLAALPRSRWRTITYWIFTFLLIFELVAGSLWNLLQIEFVRVQNQVHLGYPRYFSYILGVWQMGGAVVLIAPRFPRLKEWAYAGSFFL